MLWSEQFDWSAPEFQFLELFSGCSAASKEWRLPHDVRMCASEHVHVSVCVQ